MKVNCPSATTQANDYGTATINSQDLDGIIGLRGSTLAVCSHCRWFESNFGHGFAPPKEAISATRRGNLPGFANLGTVLKRKLLLSSDAI